MAGNKVEERHAKEKICKILFLLNGVAEQSKMTCFTFFPATQAGALTICMMAYTIAELVLALKMALCLFIAHSNV